MWILMLLLCFFLVIFPKNDQTIPYLWRCGINMQVIQRDHLDSLQMFPLCFSENLHHQQKGRIFHIMQEHCIYVVVSHIFSFSPLPGEDSHFD